MNDLHAYLTLLDECAPALAVIGLLQRDIPAGTPIRFTRVKSLRLPAPTGGHDSP